MNLSAIFSKTGKGVQEASGKTSQLSRADRAVLSAVDGKTALAEIQKKFDKLTGPKFEALIQQLDKDGYIREVSSGSQAAAPSARPAAPAAKAPPPKAPPPSSADDSDGLDFTQAIKVPSAAPKPPSAPPMDLAAASRAEAERRAKEQQANDYKVRQEAEAKAKAEEEAKARAAVAAARAKADAEAKARAEVEAKAHAEAEAKVKAAREAAVRLAAEAKAKAEAEAKSRTEAAERERLAAEERARKEAEDKARLETELNAKLEAERAKADAERRAREEAERRAAEAAERTRKELEEKAKREAEELRQRLEAEMQAKLEAERAKAEAERRAREEEDRKRREEEDRRRKEEDERRAREEAERRAKEEAERKAREEEERKRREAEERRRKEEDERRAKEEAERKKREEEERRKREEEERRRKEEDERRAKEEAERKAKDEAERKAREEADRKARDEAERKAREEADRKAGEEAERRAKEEKEEADRLALEETGRRVKAEAERRAKEEAERKAREEADRRAREESERKAKDDAERRAKEEAERKAKDDAERRAKEEAEAKAKEEAKRAAEAAAAVSLPSIEPVVVPPPPPPPAAAPAGGIADSLLADLDSFGKREEEEQKAREEAERKAKEEAERRAREEAERKAKEEQERKRREEDERRRKEEEERRAKEEAERREREEEERRREEEAERKRKAKEALAAKQTEERAARKPAGKGGPAADGVDVGDEDLDLDDIKRDQKALAGRKAAQEREAAAVTAVSAKRPKKWGKPAAIALFVLLAGGIGLLHVMPVSTADYEKAASQAMGAPVKIGSARLSVITGVELRFEGVSVGEAAKIRLVRATPEIGSLFGERKAFSRIDLEGVAIAQSQAGEALFGKIGGENFRVGRVGIKQLTLEGPLKLPPLDVEAAVSGDGSLQSVKLSGGDKLVATLSPKGGEVGFDISAGSLALPFVPALSLAEFGMKGTANRTGVVNSDFDGRVYDGVIKGSARIRWGAAWTIEGALEANGLKVAVFAPALVSDGKISGKGTYSMSGANPATLYEGARLQGDFKIEKGVLGSFDLTRALQTGGAQSGGRTVFSELAGQGLYDKGAVQLRNIAVTAGAMNAGASLDIDAGGGLAGRVVADVKTPTQTLRATLNISGKVQDPVIRK